FARIGRDQHDMLSIAMGGISAGHQVRLLRARRHACRRAAALDIEDDGGYLREIGQPEEFLHQRNARPGGSGKGTRPVPGGANGHADGRYLVLRLDDAEAILAGYRIGAVPPAEAHEGFRQGGRRRDWIPGGDSGSAIDATESRCAVAVDKDAATDRLGALEA